MENIYIKKKKKNMKRLAFFMNPSRLSWNYLMILKADLQCESPYFHKL
jgi:hypothetical protein